MRIHLTGGAGFVGRALMPALEQAGHAVEASDRVGAADGRVRALDLLDRAAVADSLAQSRPDLVIHAGAISSPMLMQGDPARMFDVNVAGTLNVVDAMRRAGLKRLVHFSSNAVYRARDDRDPVPESAALGNDDAYGASKVAAEAVVASFAAEAGFDAWMLRISSIYGPGRVSPYLISEAIQAGMDGGAIDVTDERTNMRQFVHIDDVVAAVLAAVATPSTGCVPVNITGGEYLSEETIVRTVAHHLPRLSMRIVPTKHRHGDGAHGPLDLARAKSLLGYRPAMDIGTGIAALVASSGAGSRSGRE